MAASDCSRLSRSDLYLMVRQRCLVVDDCFTSIFLAVRCWVSLWLREERVVVRRSGAFIIKQPIHDWSLVTIPALVLSNGRYLHHSVEFN